MNVLPFPTRVRIIATLVEGISIRATARLCGVDKDAVMALGVLIGLACMSLHDSLVQRVRAALIETDEVWAAIRGLAKTRYASLAALARALGVSENILFPGRRGLPDPGLAVAVWRLTGIPLDVLLTGGLTVVPATIAATPPDPPRTA